MKSFSTEQILEGIRRKDEHILRFIYSDTYPSVEKFITSNNGNGQDSEDIFQEAIVILYRKVAEEDLVLENGFKTYLISICKNIWFRELEKRKWTVKSSTKIEEVPEPPVDLDQPENELKRIIQKHLLNMDPKCRELLAMFYNEVAVEDIKLGLGFSSDAYTRK